MLKKITLKKDGHSFERSYYKLFIKEKFPNYEIYWINYFFPITLKVKV